MREQREDRAGAGAESGPALRHRRAACANTRIDVAARDPRCRQQPPSKIQSIARRPHTSPKRLFEGVFEDRAFQRAHSETPAALAPCSRTPSTLTTTPSTIATANSRHKRAAKARAEAADQRCSAPATAASAVSQASEQEREPADHQRERQVVQAAHHAEGEPR